MDKVVSKADLVKFLNDIPNDVRCIVTTGDDELDPGVYVWTGKILKFGWKHAIDAGITVDDVIKNFMIDNWQQLDNPYGEGITKAYGYDDAIKRAKAAMLIAWRAKISSHIANYIDNKPSFKQIELAKAMCRTLGLVNLPKDATKKDYDDFIAAYKDEYKEWYASHSPDVLA